ncbi:MAG TPA: hypothetical protein VNH40_12680 [Gaiellaceae bacterium]|nr:hypothetical protein [Gaiellaceae bacterium]
MSDVRPGKRFAFAGGILLTVTVALAVGSVPAAATTKCTAGMTKFGGVPARVFCGSARATVHIASKSFTFKGGTCEKTSSSTTVNIGEVVLGVVTKPKPEYFGLTVGPAAGKDGTYHTAVVAVVHAGKGYPLRADATVTLKHGRSRGTFKATSLLGGSIRGSFRC